VKTLGLKATPIKTMSLKSKDSPILKYFPIRNSRQAYMDSNIIRGPPQEIGMRNTNSAKSFQEALSSRKFSEGGLFRKYTTISLNAHRWELSK
jgi:hypothetical protein